MTQRSMPRWFPAEEVCHAHSGWYVGSPVALSLGPYDDQDGAYAASSEIRARLAGARTKGEMIRIVRAFLDSSVSAPLEPEQEIPTRAGERPRLWYRSNRFFSADGFWYFTTREGIDVGPYDSRRAAERDSERLIRLLGDLETEEARILTIREYMARPVGYRQLH